MRRDFYFFAGGFIAGIVLSIYLYRKQKKLLKKISSLEEKAKEISKRRVKETIDEIAKLLRKLTSSSKGVPLDEKEHILKKVEEKIKKLEKII
ncbi:hypothetical protein [Persephonella sp.]|uniref:hypothetical protein n=1 Tax=Persephonella sp. TaxID=2060922 RepID=UPI002634A368|nr:hypothetical protein [Persephonella sp.]